MYDTCEAHHSISEGVPIPERKFYEFSIHYKSFIRTESMPHWYCIPSQVMQMCLMSTAQPHGYCTYFIQGIANTLVSEKIKIVIKN